MKKIEQIKTLPDWQWLEQSEREIAASGTEIVDETDFVWQIGNAAVIGFMYHNMLCAPWMWFVLAKGITIGDLVDFRRLCKLIPPGTLTAVQADYERGLKFAQLYEFEDTGQTLQAHSLDYKIFRRK